MIERFGQAMRENVANGEIPFRETCLRTVIDRIEVGDHVVRVIGDTATLEQVGREKTSPRLGFAVWCASGALREIRTPDPRNRNPMLYPAELGARHGLNTGFIGFFKQNGPSSA